MKATLKKIIPFWLGRKLRGGYQKVSGLLYSGDSYYCPFCKKSFRKFLPGGVDFRVIHEKQIVGAGYRSNNVCPRCYSLDRDRLVYLFLHEKTNIFTAPFKLFHVAPEGCLRAMLSEMPNLVYIPGVKYLEGYYYDRQTQLLDITSIPYEDDSFDIVICNHVLEHIPNDYDAISEIYRILKPGGWAILQVPISRVLDKTYEDTAITEPDQREVAFGQFDHVRIYGQDYASRLEKAGFMVKTYNPSREKWKANLSQYAINPLEDLYVAYK